MVGSSTRAPSSATSTRLLAWPVVGVHYRRRVTVPSIVLPTVGTPSRASFVTYRVAAGRLSKQESAERQPDSSCPSSSEGRGGPTSGRLRRHL